MNAKVADRVPGADIERLRGYVSDLLVVAERALSQPVTFDASNHLAFMALSFAGKQVIHARSILILQGSIDATLIARSMFEGLSQLLWAAQSPNDRPEMWRAFAFVRDWRNMAKQIAKGAIVPEDKRKHVEAGVNAFGHKFLTDKARKAKKAGRKLPDDPYAYGWYDESEKKVFQAVGGDVAYDELYGPFSEWHHWRIGGFGSLVAHDDTSGKFSFNLSGQVPAMTETALASAFQCLLQTLIALDNIVSLGIANELSDIRQRYISAS